MLEAADYRSALFERFVDVVERLGTISRVLDLGPTTPGNLNFWTGRGYSYSVQDVVGREARGESCDFGAADLGGVLCWNTLSLLPADRAAETVSELYRRLLPGGALFAIFDGDGRATPPLLRYRIRDAARLHLEPTLGEHVPRPVSTAEIERLLAPFKPTRVTVMRHGSREALGQIPGLGRAGGV